MCLIVFEVEPKTNDKLFQKQPVPNILRLFISWLIDGKLFAKADIRETSELAVIPCNVIMGLFDKSFKKNSFHVGLGLHIYHLIPSKHILDILSQLGLTFD
ncbi:hypothetical protein NQ314_004646 [Rhamnusium bicolor]|uniref:Uncharacterized protein n=1 Tax=Rhamnusium bicolor TaxID=1586634 RepID=A0AAV8ZIV1_9CUCU|nr:hypothetical protein NQ314_004646 [Rhamnusium bicolor]